MMFLGHTKTVASIISDNNLNLTEDEISVAFKKFEFEINYRVTRNSYNCSRGISILRESRIKYEFLLRTLLSNKPEMFTALIKTYNSNYNYLNLNYFITIYIGSSRNNYKVIHNIGGCSGHLDIDIIRAYKILLDHYDFNVGDLNLNDSCKLEINEYREKKHGGKFVKAATVNELIYNL